jgi:hypothetical protein
MLSDLGQLQQIMEKYLECTFQGQSNINVGMVFIRLIDSMLDRYIPECIDSDTELK